MSSFVEQVFEVLSEVVSGFASVIISLFNALTGIFFTTTETGTEITFVGALLLFAAGTGLVIWGINWIRRLIRIRTRD